MEPLLFDTAMDFKEFLNSFLQTSFWGGKKTSRTTQCSLGMQKPFKSSDT